MKNIADIKKDKRLMFNNTSMDGGSGIINIGIGFGYCTFVFSFGGGWEHVSIAKSKKTPTWEEMCEIKSIFWDDSETVIQYHPSKERYVNTNENCLHLWKPINQELPVPPIIFV